MKEYLLADRLYFIVDRLRQEPVATGSATAVFQSETYATGNRQSGPNRSKSVRFAVFLRLRGPDLRTLHAGMFRGCVEVCNVSGCRHRRKMNVPVPMSHWK